MGNGPSAPTITKQDRAILDLKLQRDKVRQYQKKIQEVLNREHAIAKQQLAAGNTDRALLTLRKRKYQEGLLAKTDAQLENLDHLVSTIEFSLIEVSVLHGLQQGNEVLKQIHKEMDIESVEKLLEETAEARAYQREIDEMLSNALSAEDEEAVQGELQALRNEVLAPGQEQKVLDRVAELPSVPAARPAAEAEPEPEPQQSTEAERRERVPVAA
ncbi:Snf7-domain-containing protein [Fomitopsis betulina]|nr:Snf7-domain-containing protein [Fomitopsis betulina]